MEKTCSKCDETKPVEMFARKRGSYSSVCKACHNEYYKNYYKDTEAYAKQKERIYEWRRENKDKVMALKYGITPEQYVEGMAGLCELCGDRPAEVVDHCHATGLFRGFLCGLCNRGIGMLGDTLDSVQKAVIYLENR